LDVTLLLHRFHFYGCIRRGPLSLAVLLMLFVATPGHAETVIRLNDNTDKVLISADARFLEDPGGNYQV
jgi:hypothetical protein